MVKARDLKPGAYMMDYDYTSDVPTAHPVTVSHIHRDGGDEDPITVSWSDGETSHHDPDDWVDAEND